MMSIKKFKALVFSSFLLSHLSLFANLNKSYLPTVLIAKKISSTKLNNCVRELLPSSEHFIKKVKISSGYENDLWLINTEKNNYALRVHKRRPSNFDGIQKISREAEKFEIGPKIINSDPKRKIILLEHIKTISWPGYDNDSTPYKGAMRVLRKFHNLSISLNYRKKLIPFDTIFYTVNTLQNSKTIPSHMSIAIQKLKQIFNVLKPWLDSNKTLCHGDFHRDNILISEENKKQSFHIIDFDCTGYGHPYFDIIKFSYSLPEHQRFELFCEYLGKIPTPLEQSHFELIDLTFLMAISAHRFILAEESKEKDLFSKEELEKILDSEEELPSPFSVRYFNSSAKDKQKSATFALHKFLKKCKESHFQILLKNSQ